MSMDLQEVWRIFHEPRYSEEVKDGHYWRDSGVIRLELKSKIQLNNDEIESAYYPRALARKLRRAVAVLPQLTVFEIRESRISIPDDYRLYLSDPDVYTNPYWDIPFERMIFKAYHDDNPRLLVDTLIANNRYFNPCDEVKVEDFLEQYHDYKVWCRRKWEVQTGDPDAPTVLRRFRRVKSAERWAKSHALNDTHCVSDHLKAVWIPIEFLKMERK